MPDGKPAPQNIQDAFLNTVRREKATVVIYLVNGAKLSGRIRSFDKFSVLLESGSHDQLIFKHAISTISQAVAPAANCVSRQPRSTVKLPAESVVSSRQ